MNLKITNSILPPHIPGANAFWSTERRSSVTMFLVHTMPILYHTTATGVNGRQIIKVTSHKRHCLSNNRQLECLFNSLFMLTTRKIEIHRRYTDHLWKESAVTREICSQRAKSFLCSWITLCWRLFYLISLCKKLISYLMKDKDGFILHGQYVVGEWSGNARSQVSAMILTQVSRS